MTHPALAKMREWRDCPPKFVREVIGVIPDAWQDHVLENFNASNRIGLKACKGPGKSALKSWCVWLFMTTRPHPKVACTSITGDNLRDGLWSELALWQYRSKNPLLKSAFQWSAERIVAKQHPETWFASARTWAKGADPAQQANALAGLHGDYILFIIDEAGGVPDAVAAAAEAALASGIESKLMMGGNPTHLSGPLYRACTRERKLWFIVEISSAPDNPMRTPRVSKQWAQEQIDKYGRDNPWVRVNVFGEFPPGQSNALLGVEEVAAACRRSIHRDLWVDYPKILGVDVARFGDDRSVIFARQGHMAWRPRVFRNLNTVELAGEVGLSIQRWQPDAVFVDETGVGAGVVDKLRELGHRVIGVNSSGKAVHAEPAFANRRIDMWWQMAQWVKGQGQLPDMPELRAELAAPTYRFNSKGELVLESKDDLKKRGLESPDHADSLALTFAAPVMKREGALPGTSSAATANDYDPYAGAA